MKIEVSNGEVFDKIGILKIKQRKNAGKDKMMDYNIEQELKELQQIEPPINVWALKYIEELEQVNEKLWDVEDELRICEANQDFSEKFINLARSVYILNDKRAKLKYDINMLTKSKFVEHKILPNYEGTSYDV
jgi:hypothetical protein